MRLALLVLLVVAASWTPTALAQDCTWASGVNRHVEWEVSCRGDHCDMWGDLPNGWMVGCTAWDDP